MIDIRLLERWPALSRHPGALIAVARNVGDVEPAALLESVLLDRITQRDLSSTVDELLTAGEWRVAQDAIEVYADDDVANAMLGDVAIERERWLTGLRIRLLSLKARSSEVAGLAIPEEVPEEHALRRATGDAFVDALAHQVRDAEAQRRRRIEDGARAGVVPDVVLTRVEEALAHDHLAAAEWLLETCAASPRDVKAAWPTAVTASELSEPREVPRRRRWGWQTTVALAVSIVAGENLSRPPDFPDEWAVLPEDALGRAVLRLVDEADDAETDGDAARSLAEAVAIVVGDSFDPLLAAIPALTLRKPGSLSANRALQYVGDDNEVVATVSPLELLTVASDPHRRANLLRSVGIRIALPTALAREADWPHLDDVSLARYVAWLLDLLDLRAEEWFVETLVSVVDARSGLARALLAEVLGVASRTRLLSTDELITAWSTPRFSDLARASLEANMGSEDLCVVLAAVYWESATVTVADIVDAIDDLASVTLTLKQVDAAILRLVDQAVVVVEREDVRIHPRVRGMIVRAYPDVERALREF